MAFILVSALHKSEAYSSMHCEIVLLHVQSNPLNEQGRHAAAA
jgi:hypothetical protein